MAEYQETKERAMERIGEFKHYCDTLHENMPELYRGIALMSSLTAMPFGVRCDDPEHGVDDKVILVFQTMDPVSGAYTNHVMQLSHELFATLVERVFVPVAMHVGEDQVFMIHPKDD